MSMDDIFRAASAVEEHERARAAADSAKADAEAAARQQFRELFMSWVAESVGRLTAADVPRQRAVKVTMPPPPPPRPPAKRGFFSRFQLQPAEVPPRPVHSTIDGWTVYQMGPPTRTEPDGAFRRGGKTRWGQMSRYGDSYDGFESGQALFLTTDGRALVVVATYPVKGGLSPSAHLTEEVVYTLQVPGRAGENFVPSLHGAREQPSGTYIGFAGRDAAGLTPRELYSLGGGGPVNPSWDPYLQTREEHRQSVALNQHAYDSDLKNQLVQWEFGVRHILARAAKGLPTTPYGEPGHNA